MSMLLTAAEARQIAHHGPQSRWNIGLTPERVYQEENGGHESRNWFRGNGSFDDEEAARVAEALSKFREISDWKFSDGKLAAILDVAEESKLSGLLIVHCLEEMLKTQKSTPSLAHFVEQFDELEGPAEKLFGVLYPAQRRFERCRKKMYDAFSEDVIERIQSDIPDFPDLKELAQAWNDVVGFPFGTIAKLELTEKLNEQMVNGIAANEPWSILILYCIWLASKVPAEKRMLVLLEPDNLSDSSPARCDVSDDWLSKAKPIVQDILNPDNELIDELPDLAELIEYSLLDPDREALITVWERHIRSNNAPRKPPPDISAG
jgi:hypothetical protein